MVRFSPDGPKKRRDVNNRPLWSVLINSDTDRIMPAEWTPHSATLLNWPSNRETWPGERMSGVEKVFLQILETLLRYEPVVLLVHPDSRTHAEKRISTIGGLNKRLYMISHPVNDIWARDCGPIVVQRRLAGGESPYDFLFTDWEYNAWGGKYPPWDEDNQIPGLLAEQFGVPVEKTGLVLEGGSIETNGEGVFLTTESVLLNPNRNPGLGRDEIEQALGNHLGAKQIIWLEAGLEGDDTDGHIDDLSRFLNPSTIMTVVTENRMNPNYKTLRKNLERLQMARKADGTSFRIVTLPLPETRINGTTVDGSIHVPASYANFYIANGAVLLPLYDPKVDEQALELFQNYFPSHDIVGIPCADLIWGQGSIHCITQQLYGFNPDDK